MQTVDFSEASKNYRNEDYGTVFEAWTRHVKLVQDIGTVMEVWATFKSWDFRQAYMAKYAKIYDLADGEYRLTAQGRDDEVVTVALPLALSVVPRDLVAD